MNHVVPTLSQRAANFWRLVFLWALATHATLFTIACFYESQRHVRLDYSIAPWRASFIGLSFLFSTLFLLFGAPFFFRQLRYLVIAAWLLLLYTFVLGAVFR